MPVHNSDIAAKFDDMADLLEIQGANAFRVRAYHDAARTLRDLPHSVAAMLDEGQDLSELPGIGKDLAGQIAEIVATGELARLAKLERDVPAGLADVLGVAGIGPKRAHALHEALGIAGLEDLERAARAGHVRELEGFGAKTEENILHELETRGGRETRTPLREAEEMAGPLLEWLSAVEGVHQATIAGSYRRRKETVGDVDILVSCTRGSPVVDRFVAYEDVRDVVSEGNTRSTVILNNGLQVDLPWIEPELREDRGEIEAGADGALPQLIRRADIRGNLHSHTNASDGTRTLAQMANAARERGWSYLAITDHSRAVTVANGLDADRLAEQIDAIDALNEELEGVTLLKSCEVDILAEGRLDLPDSILKRLDLTVCAIHSHMNLSRNKQTKRVLEAMDNPYFNIMAHPTGRLIGKREPYPLDLERVIEHARESGCILEVNAQPDRLDLDDVHCKMARDAGVRLAIGTDAHAESHLDFMRYGVDQARRGWVTAADVVNTLSLKKLRKALAR